jgi:hypothetical protein
LFLCNFWYFTFKLPKKYGNLIGTENYLNSSKLFKSNYNRNPSWGLDKKLIWDNFKSTENNNLAINKKDKCRYIAIMIELLTYVDAIFTQFLLNFCTWQYATAVKKLIDAGTCNSITTTSTICGDSSLSSSYYETFTYNSYRVVIISGVPNHAAEYNQTKVNPNVRCKYLRPFAIV